MLHHRLEPVTADVLRAEDDADAAPLLGHGAELRVVDVPPVLERAEHARVTHDRRLGRDLARLDEPRLVDVREVDEDAVRLVERCEANGALVDLAHINKPGFIQAARSRPSRRLSVTRACSARSSTGGTSTTRSSARWPRRGLRRRHLLPKYIGGDGLEPVVKHFLHILDVVGEDVPALGSDWDGFMSDARPRRSAWFAAPPDALLKDGVKERCSRSCCART